MSAAALSPSYLDRFRNFLAFVGDGAEMVDRGAQATEGAMNIARNALHLRGKTNEGLDNVSSDLTHAHSAFSAFRLPINLGNLFTGATFYEKNDDGSLGKRKSLAGIAIDVAILAARVLGTTLWIHAKGAYNLTKETAKRLGHAVTAAWGVVTTLGLYLAVKDLYETPVDDAAAKQKKYSSRTQYIKEKVMNVVRTAFDFITLIFDALKTVHPACGIASGVLNLGSGLSWIAFECAWHRPV
ncbi:MAG: hypothetical protein S4CHLAM45_10400 [Chlamydiales bacterium]|nr:hypothetical protein [Chlamydiales bacterium]MCH9619534.1 hypothetical protein [Chlamydiales bacterium]MCH9623140.1 hypothetical protein [Chlamydiales bacterium]